MATFKKNKVLVTKKNKKKMILKRERELGTESSKLFAKKDK